MKRFFESMHAGQLRRTVKDYIGNDGSNIMILDPEYLPDVSLKELGKIRVKFHKWMFGNRLSKWVKNVNDCDKVARYCQAFIMKQHYKRGYREAFPIGLVVYRDDKAGSHMICVSFVDGCLKFFDPFQRFGFKELSEREKRSIIYVIF